MDTWFTIGYARPSSRGAWIDVLPVRQLAYQQIGFSSGRSKLAIVNIAGMLFQIFPPHTHLRQEKKGDKVA